MNDNEINRYMREAAVAKLRSDSVSVNEMAEKLGVDRATIHRALNSTTQGYYVYKPQVPTGMRKDEFNSRLDSILNQGRFRETLRSIASDKLLMIDVASERKAHKEQKGRGFMPRKGQLISRLINRATLVGLAWGSEIEPPPTGVPGFVSRSGKNEEKPIHFIPLCGISEGLEESLRRTSSVLAMRYDRLVNLGYRGHPDRPKLYNLNSLPIMHQVFSKGSSADDHARAKSSAVLEYLEEAHPDYAEIFGKYSRPRFKRKVEEVDTILTSVGGRDQLRPHLDRWFPTSTIKISGDGLPKTISKRNICEDIAVGDIAGILLPHPSSRRNGLICEELNSYLATLKPEHLKACREKTSLAHKRYQKRQKGSDSVEEPPAAGVVAVVNGREDIAPLLVALSKGYISRVIMDIDMEKALKRQIKTLGDEPTLEQLLE